MTVTPEDPLVPPSLPGPTPQPSPTAAGGQPASGYGPPTTTWVGPPAGSSWPAAPPVTQGEAEAAMRKARTALGWAVGATVGAFLATAIALVSLLAAGAGSGDDDYSYDPLRSEVVGLPDGSALSGDRLERPLVDLLRSYGDEDVDVSCPDTAAVSVSTAVVCSGEIEGSPWTGIVFFEDAKGTFVVLEV